MAGLPLSHIREGVQVPLYHLCTPKPLHHREPRGSCKGQHIAEGLAWGPQRCQEQWDVCLGTSGSSRSKRPADEAVSRGGGGQARGLEVNSRQLGLCGYQELVTVPILKRSISRDSP